MRVWDSSALVPLCIGEGTSEAAQRELGLDPDVVVWWATETECVSALTRRDREVTHHRETVTVALRRLDALSTGWREIQPSDRVRQIARRLLRVHALRAADALQLAAAIAVSDDQPSGLAFVTLDDRLAEAAEREGFPVVRLYRTD